MCSLILFMVFYNREINLKIKSVLPIIYYMISALGLGFDDLINVLKFPLWNRVLTCYRLGPNK